MTYLGIKVHVDGKLMSLECERGRIFDKEVSQVLVAQLKKVESARYLYSLFMECLFP